MSLHTARYMLMTDRMDWNRPHLRWINKRFYREKLLGSIRRT